MDGARGDGTVGTVVQRMIALKDLRDESVVVTHVENPEKFYCRLASNENLFNRLNELIWTVVKSPFAGRPAPESVRPGDYLLGYSAIHQNWSRSQVVEVLSNGPNGVAAEVPVPQCVAINVKLYLIDYGSVEIVSQQNLRLSTDEIIEFNRHQSFCFECALCYVKPYSETREWSSYANYLFEKLTKNKLICLKFQKHDSGVVVCDLSSLAPTNSPIIESFHSMVDYLVHTRVARYRMGEDHYHRSFPNDGPDYDHQKPNPKDTEWESDEEIIEIDLRNKNKLFY